MRHCRELAFDQKPDYGMLIELMKTAGANKGIDLSSTLFDWNVIAVCMKEHPSFYDFLDNQFYHPWEEEFAFN